MNVKYYNIRFTGNCTEEPDIRLSVPEGLTETWLKNWDSEIQKIQTAYGEEHNENFSAFDIKNAIESAAEKLGIEIEYPKADYTIYI